MELLKYKEVEEPARIRPQKRIGKNKRITENN